MQAIETIYNGYRFRSRLEARWAVFFDTLNISWEYEKEGYDLGNGVSYLPDFWLPTLNYWIEIKGKFPTPEEISKLDKLTEGKFGHAFIFSGEVGLWRMRNVYENHMLVNTIFEGTSIMGKDEYGWDGDWRILECPTCGLIQVSQWWCPATWAQCGCEDPYTEDMRINDIQQKTPRLIAAYKAARQAQFEHGKHGN